MSTWLEAYENAHTALKGAHQTIEKLAQVTEGPDTLTARVCCAADALHGVRALLDEAGAEQKARRPGIALDVGKVLKLARLNRGVKRRQEWDSGTDICKQLEELHKVDPAEVRRLIAAIEDGIRQAKHKGLHLDSNASATGPNGHQLETAPR